MCLRIFVASFWYYFIPFISIYLSYVIPFMLNEEVDLSHDETAPEVEPDVIEIPVEEFQY